MTRKKTMILFLVLVAGAAMAWVIGAWYYHAKGRVVSGTATGIGEIPLISGLLQPLRSASGLRFRHLIEYRYDEMRVAGTVRQVDMEALLRAHPNWEVYKGVYEDPPGGMIRLLDEFDPAVLNDWPVDNWVVLGSEDDIDILEWIDQTTAPCLNRVFADAAQRGPEIPRRRRLHGMPVRQLAQIQTYELPSMRAMLFLSVLVNAPLSLLTGMLFPLACRWLDSRAPPWVRIARVLCLMRLPSDGGIQSHYSTCPPIRALVLPPGSFLQWRPARVISCT